MSKENKKDESHLWDKKYEGSRVYKNVEDFFAFSQNNPTIVAIISFIKSGQSILEVGSGTGELISYIQYTYKNTKTFGLDYSEESIKRSKENSSRFNLDINFQIGDIKKLPFEDNYFDIVFGDQVIGHVDDPELALKEIYRVTKVGGIVAFSIANSLRPDGWYIYTTLSQNHLGYKQKGMFPWTLSLRMKKVYFSPIKFYGEMLILFRTFSTIKSCLSRVASAKWDKNITELKNKLINQNLPKNKNILKKIYYSLENALPAWTKVTIGILARK